MKTEADFRLIKEDEFCSILTREFTINAMKNFSESSSRTISLLALPTLLLAEGFRGTKYASIMISEIHKQGLAQKLDDQINREIIDEFTKDFREATLGKSYAMDEVTEATRYLNELIQESKLVAEAHKALLLNVLTNTWTSFESSCKDLWIAMANAHPNNISGNESIFSGKGKTIEGVEGKSIQIGLLSQFDFNIKNHLGTILQEKFRFTSCNDIYEAYTKTFKKLNGIDNLKALELRQLELTRNLIVHKGGKVDEQYLRLTKNTDLTVGDAYEPSMEIVTTYFNKATEAFYNLVKVCDKL
ncbi:MULTISPECIES: hypothetical protein [unclassified Imperialibacter]|uniref:hypothetical protein n=1 Tax=unclassified Imperialibacter TaxID=2629706 RepID=UPI00125A5B37|nr:MULTISPECIES: hypothetical protein [unclassified Imperialibacter]CAD5276982.1 conserved hypothetical protein [Imperialibacter sp. 89]CAD5295307.1 conserved hypothetical protein [Imperialibacter sp. 75]VVT29188.1 hypothetical protein IMPR6_480027 [Imperialibacter sp. EC-SDR9]